MPQDVGKMSMWQYMAALDGYIKANTPDEPGKLSETEKDDLWDWIKAG